MTTVDKLTANIQPLDVVGKINEVIDNLGGGGGSYTLPVASTTTLGGVKVDGTSITISNEVISSTVDSSLSSSSTNPVQNSIIYPSLSNFIPADTYIDVKADGSKDFTTLSAAFNFLVGKWSNGTVYIRINGTISETSGFDFNGRQCNIPNITLVGANSGTVSFSSTSGMTFYNQKLIINGLTVNLTTGSTSTLYIALLAGYNSSVTVLNSSFSGGWIGAQESGTLQIQGDSLAINNSLVAMYARFGGRISFNGASSNSTFTSNCFWLLQAWEGGWIAAYNYKLSFTGSNLSLVPRGTVTNNGYTTYPASWES